MTVFRPKMPAFGLDLSDLSLKIVQLEKSSDANLIRGLYSQSIKPGIFEGGEIKDFTGLSKDLKEALERTKKHSLLSNRVVCNLSEEKVFVRVINMPMMSETDLAKAIYYEAEANIPLDIKDVYLSWQVANQRQAHRKNMEVMIAAAPKRIVDSYVKLLQGLGLEPVALEPESVAVVRALMKQGELKPTIITDIGAAGTSFVIYAHGALRFSSHIDISGRQLEQAIIKEMKVSAAKAVKLKIEVGLDKDKEAGKVYRALKPKVDQLCKQILDYIEFYHEHAHNINILDGAIEQIVMCGGDSLLVNLQDYLSQETNLPVVLGNPLAKVKASLGVKLAQGKSLPYATAIGLALREFNL